MTTNTNSSGIVTRRGMLKLAGAGVSVLAVLTASGCASSPSGSPSPSSLAAAAPNLAPGDTSNGADNFFTSDKVDVQRVSFKNQYQMTVVGNLFVPKDLNRNEKTPAMVVGHPMGAVKEQSANLYATKMAEQGFVTMSLDLSFWGESEGQPRNAVSPDIYAEDFSAAVDYLRTQPFVDRGAHRCDRYLRQRQLRDQRRQDRPAHQGRRHRQHVRHGCGQSRRAAQRAQPRAASADPRTGRRTARCRIRWW